MIRKTFVSALLVIAVTISAYGESSIKISDAWIRALPEGSTVTAAYFTIENSGGEDDKLVAVTSDFASTAEMHTTEVDSNDVATMKKLEWLEIPKNTTVELKPGATHLMLIDVKSSVADGDSAKLILEFERAGSIEIEALVKDTKMHQHHH